MSALLSLNVLSKMRLRNRHRRRVHETLFLFEGVRRRLGVGAANAGDANAVKPAAAVLAAPLTNRRRETSMINSSV